MPTADAPFRTLDEETLDRAEPSDPAPSDLGARFWFAFDRWLAVPPARREEEFVFA
ncbi:MAG: hypothetical protein JST00_12965 [Deltaproteobacteria bacterium]|nr:hypothetical protein [Deltaproteobacteria bacterium]